MIFTSKCVKTNCSVKIYLFIFFSLFCFRLSSGLTEVEVVKVFCDVCDAVSRLHHMNPPLIHRDLKASDVPV